ncbi:MAG: SRPBCC family protein [Kofleriaceae bacterium]
MQHERQVQLVRRVLAHLDARTTDREPAPTRIPISAYVDPDRFVREHAALFRGLPLAVAHASQLSHPGDFVTHDASGVPLLIVRGDDGALAAFLNVCRHRGTQLEAAPCGSKKAFVCPYHAWMYARDGKLASIPHADGFVGDGGPWIDPAERGLVRVPVATIAGIVFVVPTPGATLDPTWLGPLAEDLAGFGVPAGQVYAPRVERHALHWKLAIDIFLEAYHLRPTHRTSIYGLFFDNVALVDPSGPHTRNVFPKRTIRELATLPEDTWSLRHHANVLFHIFPNTLVLIEPDHVAVLHLWPRGPAETLMTSYTLVPEPPTTDKARAYWDANNAILYDATAEDFAMGASIQRGLTSGANADVVFGAFEHALAHFHRQIEQTSVTPKQ